MSQISTITRKRQLTIPAKAFREAGLKEGQKVLVTHENGKLSIQSAGQLVEKLAGSVSVPTRFKGKNIDNIIRQAKQEYFKKNYKA